MRIFSLFLLIGSMLIQLFATITATLPFLFLLLIILILALVTNFYFKNKHKLLKKIPLMLVALFLGFSLSSIAANRQIQHLLTKELEGKDIIIEGIIKDIPDNRKDGIRFKFKINKAYIPGKTLHNLNISGIVRLSWFQKTQTLHAGEKWRLRIRLKRPSGFINPGGFDYEKWLFSQRIIATGYVRKAAKNGIIQSASPWSIDHLRETIDQRIQAEVKDKQAAAILSALAVAGRKNLDDSQWKVLQKTGTSHLIAISGLHIAVIAGFAFFPILLIWRLFPRLNEVVPVQVAGGIAGVIFATLYALLAGFNLPTQRALLMVVVILIGLIQRKNYTPSTILSIALVAVLLLDPLAAMTISFWLSFSAVALILLILKRQIVKTRFQFLYLQLFLSLGMLPLTLIFFGTGSISAPIANLLAIPWVSFLVIPINLLAVVFMPISETLSSLLLNFSALFVQYLFQFLDFISKQEFFDVSFTNIPLYFLFLAVLATLFFLLPNGFPGRWMSIILLIPALSFSPPKTEKNSFKFILLDVGQGHASVIHTAKHTLIYDTGTRLSSSFDIGKLVVNPYLKSTGTKTIDIMIVSHNNLDHRGGAKSIIQQYNVKKILGNNAQIIKKIHIDLCKAGQKWQWDGVNFEILWPDDNQLLNDNNQSCVLRVSNKYHSILLTGDIQHKAELELVKRYQDKLASNVIIMPHHGSKTSSSENFLNKVKPRLALISTGYRNRFKHPHQVIIKRYQMLPSKIMNTVDCGAIEINFPASDRPFSTQAYRLSNQRFWNR